ncbi:hypothetical protein [Streptomyces sp. V1I1]|nr:hypothetical protein [Streptomyces sp. V1I1]MDQ0943256.1 hypothetical protein [Streptomyces sp. V1I1]
MMYLAAGAFGLGIVVGIGLKVGIDHFKAKVRNALYEEVDGILKERDKEQ